MKKRRASEIFGVVDPHLKVIDGGRRHKCRSSQEDWEASGGVICPRCGEEAIRFRSEDGVCRQCADFLNDKKFSDDKKRAKFLRFVKAHNARIEKNRRRCLVSEVEEYQ